MVKCTFCGDEIPFGTGTIYAKKDGKVFNFCSNKCEKNMIKLGRKARKTDWTAEYRKEQEMKRHESEHKKTEQKTAPKKVIKKKR